MKKTEAGVEIVLIQTGPKAGFVNNFSSIDLLNKGIYYYIIYRIRHQQQHAIAAVSKY